jgi:hypothetical protein
MALVAAGAAAQDPMKKDGSMAKDGMPMKSMTMQECKDHMAMSTKEGMKKDDAMMKKDAMCADMMKKDGGMKKDGMSGDPMKK